MSILSSVAEKTFRALGAQTSSRNYAAAKQNRLVGDWTTTSNSANQEIKGSTRVLRARARQLAKDDDYFGGFLKELDSNVIGARGIQLQVDAKSASGKKDAATNKAVEAAWSLWSRKRFCTVTGQDNLRESAALALRTLAVDGEFLIRIVFDNSNPFNFALQFLDVDWLDEDYNDPQLSNGNRVIMSVEVDAFDKPVAYWFTAPRWGSITVPREGLAGTMQSQSNRVRIPAEQIIHRFLKVRPGQQRGVTWAHSAMLRLNMLGGYEEAELVGARVAASQMAFVSPPTDEGQTGSINRQTASVETEVSPGTISELPAGYTVHEWSPNRPGTTYSIFVKNVLRAVAVGLGISYNTLTSDLESTSYSSMRGGSIKERDIWRRLQEWLADNLYQDIYEKWLFFNINTAQLPVSASLLDAVMYPIWRPRGFDWVDPSKDTQADVLALDKGIKTRTEILSERGRDFEDTMEQLAYEKAYCEGLGLEFNVEKAADKEESDDEDSTNKPRDEKKEADDA